MRYTAEIRTFENDEFDYIHDTIKSNNYENALNDARNYASEIGGKIKINIIDEKHPKYDAWIIYSKTYTYSAGSH